MAVKNFFIGAVVAAIVSYASYWGYKHGTLPDWYWEARLPDSVEPLDITDTANLKKVLFGGDPWLIQCYSGLPYEGQHLPRPFRIHNAFKESITSLRGLVRFGTIDCERPLSSNKTLVDKFGLVRRTQPLLIFAAGGDKPKQVPAASASSAYAITAWVKPKAEPKIHSVKTTKDLQAACSSRRRCLLARMDRDSTVLDQLARRFRSVEIVALGKDESKLKLSWGRGDEVGETLEPDEARHLGKTVSFFKPDPEVLSAAGKKPPSLSAPRLLRGFSGDEDLPSLSLFLQRALDAPDDEGFMRTPLPTILAPEKKKAAANDNAEVQARRAKKRAAAKAREEAEAAERASAAQQEKAASAAEQEEQRRLREQQRRAQMAEEEARAGNIVEEVEDEDEDEEEEAEAEVEEEYEEDALDLDA